jgi:hypothetical protein
MGGKEGVVLNDAFDSRTASYGGPDHPGPAHHPVRTWPLLVLALPASVAVWSGWVGIGEMTGFGVVRPLPGIWDSFHLDTAVTLPVGVETYAAMALRAWLTSSALVAARTRRFARWSAIGALVLGIAGQVAYHLLAEAHVNRAPWIVTTLVASLPVVVLGFGTALAHMLRADASATDDGDYMVLPGPADRGGADALWDQSACADQSRDDGPPYDPGWHAKVREAVALADDLVAAGQRVSRRNLRAAGLHGSNTELSELARQVRADTMARSALPGRPVVEAPRCASATGRLSVIAPGEGQRHPRLRSGCDAA